MINGLVFGGIYAILAMGFSLVFGVAKILNLANTTFYMLAAFIMYFARVTLGLHLLLSVVLSIVLTGIVGIIYYKLCLDRIKEHAAGVITISIAVAIFFQEIFLIEFGSHFRGVPPFIGGFVEIAGIRTTNQHFIAVVVGLLVIVSLWWMLSRTRIGNAIRVVAEDREIANVMGIDVSRMCLIIVGISTVLAAVAGVVVAPILKVHPLMWLPPLAMVLAVVVLGGLGNIKGSIIASFILGFTEVAVVFLVPGGAFLRGAVAMIIMVVVLLLRPEGLFGVVFEEERL